MGAPIAGADVGAPIAGAANRFDINTTAIVPATVDCQCLKKRGIRPQTRCEKCEKTHIACGGGDNVRPDHDNATYIEIYRHRRDILFNLRQETLELHSEDDALLVVAIGARPWHQLQRARV